MKKIILTIAGLLFFCSAAVSASAALFMPVKFTIENGDFNQSTVSVEKNGNYIYSTQGAHTLRLRLEYGCEYLLAFTKPGYITKKIKVNTVVPEERLKNGFNPYKIGVRIYKQYEGVNIVVYNQPVAYVRYHAELDEFAYDVDYTKSILSDLETAETTLEKRAVEERRMLSLKPTAVRTPASSDAQPEVKKTEQHSSHEGIDKPAPLATPALAVPVSTSATDSQTQSAPANGLVPTSESSVVAGEEKNKPEKASSGAEQPPPAKPVVGQDKNPSSNSFLSGEEHPTVPVRAENAELMNANKSLLKGTEVIPSVTRSVEEIHKTIRHSIEGNRTVTTIQLQQGSQITEYRRVFYNWGGQFYFQNGTRSIPQSLFDSYIQDIPADSLHR